LFLCVAAAAMAAVTSESKTQVKATLTPLLSKMKSHNKKQKHKQPILVAVHNDTNGTETTVDSIITADVELFGKTYYTVRNQNGATSIQVYFIAAGCVGVYWTPLSYGFTGQLEFVCYNTNWLASGGTTTYGYLWGSSTRYVFIVGCNYGNSGGFGAQKCPVTFSGSSSGLTGVWCQDHPSITDDEKYWFGDGQWIVCNYGGVTQWGPYACGGVNYAICDL